MTILVCLLSDQHVPNLLSVHHFRPERLVLVETDEMQRKGLARHFLNALRLGGLDYSGRCEIAPLVEENSLRAVRSALSAVYVKYPSDRWIANITGGAKPMSVASYQFFKESGSRVVYTNVYQPSEIMDIDADTREICTYRPKITEFLAGYGFECRKRGGGRTDVEKRALRCWDCARAIAAKARPRSLLPLSDGARDHARENGLTIGAGQLQSPDESLREKIAATFSLDPVRGTGRLSPFAADFLTGGWLEVFFWGLITRHAEALACWDICRGLEVHRAGDSSGNELDVAFMNENRLSLIECKSGSQDHDRKGDILYKVAAVALQFHAVRVHSYLATMANSILNGRSIKPNIRTRAEIYRCRILTAEAIRDLAKHADDVAFVRTTLFGSPQSQSSGHSG